MTIKLKPIHEQVVVITGASSGIGLETAQLFSHRGAQIVLAARSEKKLAALADQLKFNHHRPVAVTADVSDRAQVEQIARTAVNHFGRIDTWINNAGLSIYGRLDTVSDEDNRRLFDINFWGVVYGSLVALPYLKKQGGALINLGSEVSEAVVPLQGMYSASKHAVKGFTDALRIEIEEVDKAQVSITLIQPTAVETPFPQHARNYMPKEPKLPDPKVSPMDVAKAILQAATKHSRHIKVGFNAKLNTFMSNNAPRTADHMSAKYVHRQNKEIPAQHPEGTLYEAGEMEELAGQAL